MGRRIGVALATFALLVAFLVSPLSEFLSLLSYDSLFWLRGIRTAPQDIVIVAIDEDSFAEINKPWPWPRSIHAKLVRSLFEAGARAVAFDIVFAEPSDPAEDEELASSLRQFGPVILASTFDVVDDRRFIKESLVLPIPVLSTPHTVPGYVNYSLDSDAFLRRVKPRSAEINSLAWEAARAFHRNLPAPGDSDRERFINFTGPSRNITTISYSQALSPAQYLKPGFLENKLVFVGLSTSIASQPTENSPDRFPTPFSHFGAQRQTVAGVEVQATVAENYLTQSFIHGVSFSVTLVATIVIAALSFLSFSFLTPVIGFVVAIGSGFAMIAGSYALFTLHNAYLPYSILITPLAFCYTASLLTHYLAARQERNYIRGIFSNYVSPEVVGELLKHPDKLKLGGTKVQGTVLFLDLAGFTSFSENLSPEDLISVINRNIGALSDIMLSNSGMVDKYIGDAIMAVWGVPLPNQNHAVDACNAALLILQRIEALNREEAELSGVELSVRIGVNSGEMVAGNVGGKHVNYTVLGNAVNLASRLEGVNRLYQTRLLIGEETARLVDLNFLTRHIDTLRVKGQQQPVRVFEAMCPRELASASLSRLCSLFREAREQYELRAWQSAADAFSFVLTEFPHDGPSRTLSERCLGFLRVPPPDSWDGVYDMETK